MLTHSIASSAGCSFGALVTCLPHPAPVTDLAMISLVTVLVFGTVIVVVGTGYVWPLDIDQRGRTWAAFLYLGGVRSPSNPWPSARPAQRVQKSGFPQAYAKWEANASNAVLAVHGVAPIDGDLTMDC